MLSEKRAVSKMDAPEFSEMTAGAACNRKSFSVVAGMLCSCEFALQERRCLHKQNTLRPRLWQLPGFCREARLTLKASAIQLV